MVAKGLELLDVAIDKNLSPNMSVLLNSKNDLQFESGQIMDVGNILSTKLCDQYVAVRSTALQVVKTISTSKKSN